MMSVDGVSPPVADTETLAETVLRGAGTVAQGASIAHQVGWGPSPGQSQRPQPAAWGDVATNIAKSGATTAVGSVFGPAGTFAANLLGTAALHEFQKYASERDFAAYMEDLQHKKVAKAQRDEMYGVLGTDVPDHMGKPVLKGTKHAPADPGEQHTEDIPDQGPPISDKGSILFDSDGGLLSKQQSDRVAILNQLPDFADRHSVWHNLPDVGLQRAMTKIANAMREETSTDGYWSNTPPPQPRAPAEPGPTVQTFPESLNTETHEWAMTDQTPASAQPQSPAELGPAVQTLPESLNTETPGWAMTDQTPASAQPQSPTEPGPTVQNLPESLNTETPEWAMTDQTPASAQSQSPAELGPAVQTSPKPPKTDPPPVEDAGGGMGVVLAGIAAGGVVLGAGAASDNARGVHDDDESADVNDATNALPPETVDSAVGGDEPLVENAVPVVENAVPVIQAAMDDMQHKGPGRLMSAWRAIAYVPTADRALNLALAPVAGKLLEALSNMRTWDNKDKAVAGIATVAALWAGTPIVHDMVPAPYIVDALLWMARVPLANGLGPNLGHLSMLAPALRLTAEALGPSFANNLLPTVARHLDGTEQSARCALYALGSGVYQAVYGKAQSEALVANPDPLHFLAQLGGKDLQWLLGNVGALLKALPAQQLLRLVSHARSFFSMIGRIMPSAMPMRMLWFVVGKLHPYAVLRTIWSLPGRWSVRLVWDLFRVSWGMLSAPPKALQALLMFGGRHLIAGTRSEFAPEPTALANTASHMGRSKVAVATCTRCLLSAKAQGRERKEKGYYVFSHTLAQRGGHPDPAVFIASDMLCETESHPYKYTCFRCLMQMVYVQQSAHRYKMLERARFITEQEGVALAGIAPHHAFSFLPARMRFTRRIDLDERYTYNVDDVNLVPSEAIKNRGTGGDIEIVEQQLQAGRGVRSLKPEPRMVPNESDELRGLAEKLSWYMPMDPGVVAQAYPCSGPVWPVVVKQHIELLLVQQAGGRSVSVHEEEHRAVLMIEQFAGALAVVFPYREQFLSSLLSMSVPAESALKAVGKRKADDDGGSGVVAGSVEINKVDTPSVVDEAPEIESQLTVTETLLPNSTLAAVWALGKHGMAYRHAALKSTMQPFWGVLFAYGYSLDDGVGGAVVAQLRDLAYPPHLMMFHFCVSQCYFHAPFFLNTSSDAVRFGVPAKVFPVAQVDPEGALVKTFSDYWKFLVGVCHATGGFLAAKTLHQYVEQVLVPGTPTTPACPEGVAFLTLLFFELFESLVIHAHLASLDTVGAFGAYQHGNDRKNSVNTVVQTLYEIAMYAYYMQHVEKRVVIDVDAINRMAAGGEHYESHMEVKITMVAALVAQLEQAHAPMEDSTFKEGFYDNILNTAARGTVMAAKASVRGASWAMRSLVNSMPWNRKAAQPPMPREPDLPAGMVLRHTFQIFAKMEGTGTFAQKIPVKSAVLRAAVMQNSDAAPFLWVRNELAAFDLSAARKAIADTPAAAYTTELSRIVEQNKSADFRRLLVSAIDAGNSDARTAKVDVLGLLRRIAADGYSFETYGDMKNLLTLGVDPKLVFQPSAELRRDLRRAGHQPRGATPASFALADDAESLSAQPSRLVEMLAAGSPVRQAAMRFLAAYSNPSVSLHDFFAMFAENMDADIVKYNELQQEKKREAEMKGKDALNFKPIQRTSVRYFHYLIIYMESIEDVARLVAYFASPASAEKRLDFLKQGLAIVVKPNDTVHAEGEAGLQEQANRREKDRASHWNPLRKLLNDDPSRNMQQLNAFRVTRTQYTRIKDKLRQHDRDVLIKRKEDPTFAGETLFQSGAEGRAVKDEEQPKIDEKMGEFGMRMQRLAEQAPAVQKKRRSEDGEVSTSGL